jgi:putative membrane protein
MRVALAAAAFWAVVVVRVTAHAGELHGWTEPGALSVWDIGAIAFLGVIGGLYLAGARRLARRRAVCPRWQRLAFLCGWSALLTAVLPPLDALAIQLFSAHMLQHELMMLVGAPLVIAGRPLATCMWGLPARLRPVAGETLQRPVAAGVWRFLTAPAVAWALHGAVIWAWHIPALYDAAVGHEAIHAVQHAMFVGTSALFWWGLLYGRYGRAGYGAAVFYVFTTVVHTGLLGAMLTFAGVPLYPAYLEPALSRGIDPLQDQQIAGLVMWIPAGIVLTLLGIGLFSAWVGEAERRALRGVTR